MDFHVAGSLEFFVDHVIHARAGVDQRGGDDGERSALLDVARRAEETLGALERICIHAARQHLAGGWHNGVVGARKARDGVEQDDDVLLVFDQALGFFQHHFCDLHMACCGFVKGRRHHFALDRALHFRDFFGALVYQQNDQVNIGKICRDRMRYVLQHHRLAALRARHEQAALSLADRGDDVDNAAG